MIIFMSEICSKISIFSCFHFRTEYINIHLPCEIFIFYQMWFRWQWCWWLYDCDWFQTLVAESLCWRLFSLFWWFSQCIKSVTNISNLSPTHLVLNIRHQNQCNLSNWNKSNLGQQRQKFVRVFAVLAFKNWNQKLTYTNFPVRIRLTNLVAGYLKSLNSHLMVTAHCILCTLICKEYSKSDCNQTRPR